MQEIFYAEVHYSGRVQGVGFRYTTLQLAKEYEVAGLVSNLSDGRVKLEAEGAEREVRAFLTAVQEKLHGHIGTVDETSAARVPRFSGFEII